MRLVAVGTGTVVPEGDRGGTCFYVEDGEARILVDCGPGTVQGLARLNLPWEAVTDLILTHFHVDHVGAVPGYFFALKHGIVPLRTDPLSVWGPPGTRRLFSRLAAALGDFMLDPGFQVQIHELNPGDRRQTSGGLEVSVRPTAHTEESHAVRLQGRDAAVAYTGDTGLPADEAHRLGEFLAGVDVLIAECSLTDAEVGDNHLSPSRLAALAAVAQPGILWITHVYPHVRNDNDLVRLLAAAGHTGPARVLEDGDSWTTAA